MAQLHMRARHAVIVLLVVLSLIPQIIMLPVLGSINLIFLAVIWIFLIVLFLKTSKIVSICGLSLSAIAMAVPPLPNYVGASSSGRLYMNFIGTKNIFDGAYGIVFFFGFYFAIFLTFFLLIRHKRLIDRPNSSSAARERNS